MAGFVLLPLVDGLRVIVPVDAILSVAEQTEAGTCAVAARSAGGDHPDCHLVAASVEDVFDALHAATGGRAAKVWTVTTVTAAGSASADAPEVPA